MVYFFGDGKADGNAGMKEILGGKGANLAEMNRIGVPVPAGFTISTEVCKLFEKTDVQAPKWLVSEVYANLKKVEQAMGAVFGDAKNPLLVSVRSGARDSMPGMMDTILNLGLNDKTVEALAARTGNPRFAWDSYRRFVSMYGDVVMGMPEDHKTHRDPFEVLLEKKKEQRKVKFDNELTAEDWKDLVGQFKAAILKATGKAFPDDPRAQLWGAIKAVFDSWHNRRAYEYRKMNGIPHEWGTAVNVQSMVYGNMGDNSGTGVAFTRDPATGERVFFGEYLINAQGEDVVAGVRTPLPISQLDKDMPKVYAQLTAIYQKLEKHYRDMQDLEFTVQEGKLWMLQTRNGKRTGFAAINIAVDMVREGLINPREALLRLKADQLNQILQPIFDLKDKKKAIAEGRLLAKGLNAGPGAACGRIAFTPERAMELAAKDKVVLTRVETSPEDIAGMQAAVGILTARGGATSHAALVARQMGKVCVAGCGALDIDYVAGTMKVKGFTLKEGDWLSIDGTTGEVIAGAVATSDSEVIQALLPNPKLSKPEQKKLMAAASKGRVYQNYLQIMSWADQYRRLKVRTNADQPDQAQSAVAFGAEGIGLCRTEHMFFGEGSNNEKISAVREMILSGSEAGRKAALKKLLPMQRKDFEGIFLAMGERPVTIRTLDPPLHEFLPNDEASQKEIGERMGLSVEQVKAKVHALHESNPMLGHRGCRLGITYPEITEMQARAIFEAAATVAAKGVKVHPEVMIPLVGHKSELVDQAGRVRAIAEEIVAKAKVKFPYLIGTMIEVPRAALTAGEIATVAEFFSFGTNDLTQMGMGISRDDAGVFLKDYAERGVLEYNPFETLDTTGIGRLMQIACADGSAARPGIKLGICGEHGGDPASIEFCNKLGLNYVSCSPFRVPIARLAAAIAELKQNPPAKKAPAKKAVAKKVAKVAKPAVKPVAKKVAPKVAPKAAKPVAKKAPAKKAK
ncbi:MAG: pyruvate, phosphate dikinase [Candidatus Delongbacteria bacterium]